MAAGPVGAALFYGDGVITPAISVLSAVEGLKMATPRFEPYIVPISLVLLIGLFLVQRRGTAAVGGPFGSVMLVWFAVLGLLGVRGIMQHPRILLALDPTRGITLLFDAPWRGFVMLGSVFLAMTGAEALYADMGHFGRTAIRTTWLRLVFPALILNYFGQGLCCSAAIPARSITLSIASYPDGDFTRWWHWRRLRVSSPRRQ